MFVRRQDKKCLMPVERLSILVSDDSSDGYFEIIAFDVGDTFDDGYWTLGKYKSDERAMEVLDDICKWIVIQECIPPIYQMPEE